MPNGRIARVQVPSHLKVNARASNDLRLPSVLRLHDLRLRSVPMGSARVVLSVLGRHGRRRRSGLLLPAQARSGVRLPASSHVQPARVSVCASAVAVRS